MFMFAEAQTIAAQFRADLFTVRMPLKPKIFRPVPATKKVSDIQQSDIIHKQLSRELEEGIRKLQSTFAEVFKRTHEEWLDGFRRDLNPESEIRVWEAMASAHQTFFGEHALSLPAKKEALASVLRPNSIDGKAMPPAPGGGGGVDAAVFRGPRRKQTTVSTELTADIRRGWRRKGYNVKVKFATWPSSNSTL
jgi:hypothetical protein